ncbi:MAG TPA: hypothetical protein VFL83_04335 [Anaeromyxobacter sp.]|nr:hypothetical protein [Anaeromyxobacter sp.]
MRNRILLALAAAVALAAPRAGSAGEGWSLTLGVWGGVSRYDVLGLAHGVGSVGAADGQDLIEGNFNTVGGSALLRIRWFDVGLLYEGTLLDTDARNEVLTPLVGVAWDLSQRWRLDVLAELGGHRITGVGSGNDLVTDTETVWLPYVGVRPSFSYRLPVGPAALVLSATPFARWDLVRKDVSVPTSSLDPTVYEAGGTTFGLVFGAGMEL